MTSTAARATIRTAINLEARASVAPLTAALPPHASSYLAWPPPHLRSTELPEYLNVATVASEANPAPDGTENEPLRLMGPPIHVQAGGVLSVALRNSLATTGLSLHWHGFEMEGALAYDGVVGITQCPIAPGEVFRYNFTVNEVPGTYWYHTHSGEVGVEAYNAVRGALIVHPPIEVDASGENVTSGGDVADAVVMHPTSLYRDLLYYRNERILFLSDGSHHSGGHVLLHKMGGLNPPISYNDDHMSVGTSPWEFGTCNGRLREIVPVSPGQKYKFRIINAGSLFALRIAVDGFKLTIIAADSEPVIPYEVDEVILHAAERFDVMLTVPENAVVGMTSWIRADTLESRAQGYQNGIRAILRVASPGEDPIRDEDVSDPEKPIATLADPTERVTMNCYSRVEKEGSGPKGGCLPITDLKYNGNAEYGSIAKSDNNEYEVHTIDFEFSSPPQFAHFTRLNKGQWLQHAHSSSKTMLSPSFDTEVDLHPNAAVLDVKADSTVLLIWRNKSTMDHPIHLHGLKMEILDIHIPKKEDSCLLNQCRLSEAFSSPETVEALAATATGTSVLKDTFILPAGGVVAARIRTGNPALWYAHCHLDVHHETGMALILRVGGYSPSEGDWLPDDYPACDTPFVKTKTPFPSCDCYVNTDAVLGGGLSDEHRCSRDHLCFHEGPMANLESYPNVSEGLSIQSRYSTPGWAISLIIVAIIVLLSLLLQSLQYREHLTKSTRTWMERRKKDQHHKSCNARRATGSALSDSASYSSDNGEVAPREKDQTDKDEEAAIESDEVAEVPPKRGISFTPSTFDIHAKRKMIGRKVRNAAVIILDYQNEFVHENGKLHDDVKLQMSKNGMLKRLPDFVDEAREIGAQIIHSPVILHGSEELNTVGWDPLKYSELKDVFQEGTWNAQFASELTPEVSSGDIILEGRRAYDAFEGTRLKQLLEEMGIEFIFICGFLTNVCVQETALSASNLLDTVYIVQDCVAAKTERGQQEALMDRLPLFSSPVTAEHALEILNGFRPHAETKVPSLSASAERRRKTSTLKSRRSTVTVQVERSRPISMDLPNDTKRRSRRSTIAFSGLSGSPSRSMRSKAEPLPVSEIDFVVPPRRPTILSEFRVDGFEVDGSLTIKQDRPISGADVESPFWDQLKEIIASQWTQYRPTCVNLLRVVEVVGLAFLTGALFYDTGNDTTATGFGSTNSLLFFSITLWTFTRMYPAIASYFAWNQQVQIISNEHRYSLGPVCVGRFLVVMACEAWWPFVYVLVCYPLAGIVGDWKVVLTIGMFLCLNNMCYISIGSCLGVLVPSIPHGMITSTIVSQTSLVAAGFYTTLPSYLSWIRYMSPVFWTFSGIVKTAYHWSDTYGCRWGSTLAGVNRCFLENSPVIDNMKERGINVATYGDEQSDKIWLQVLVLLLLFLSMQTFIFLYVTLRQIRETKWEVKLEQLAEYKAIHRDTRVPLADGDKAELGKWVEGLKRRKGKLTDEQVERLDELEFEWEWTWKES